MTENTQHADGQDESEASQAGVPAVPASPVLAAPAVPAAPAVATRNQAEPRRYRENPVRQLFPGWKYPTKLGKQDESYFQGYSNDIRALEETAQQYEVCGPAVLAASEKIYDDELARRESINTRCGAVLSTGGILGALFVAAGQLGLIQEKGKFGVLAGFLLAAFIIGLVYIGCSITMALAIQGQVKGNVVDPSNISTADKADINRYQIKLAINLMNYTVANYRVNNAFKFKLNSAQRCLRNGIIAIIVAGMLSPWTLRTAASNGSSALPSPVANHQIVDPSLTAGWIPSELQFHAVSDDCGCGAPKICGYHCKLDIGAWSPSILSQSLAAREPTPCRIWHFEQEARSDATMSIARAHSTAAWSARNVGGGRDRSGEDGIAETSEQYVLSRFL